MSANSRRPSTPPGPSAGQAAESALGEARRLLASAPAQAAAPARLALSADPGSLQAALMLGAALRRGGDPHGAREVLVPLALAHPSAWGVQFEAGAAAAMLGETSAAIAALTRACELNGRSSLALHALGDQLTIAGDLEGGEAAQARSVPGCVHDGRLVAAAVALLEGLRPLAERELQERFGMSLADPLTLRLLADIGLRHRRYEEVEALIAPAVFDSPACLPLRLTYAQALQAQHKTTEALAEVEVLLAQVPGALIFRLFKAGLMTERGDYEAASDIYGALLAEDPTDARVWLSHGHVLKTLGRQADCIAAYRQSINISPSLGEAYWSLANLKVAPFEPRELATMRRLLSDKALGDGDRIPVLFALGKGLEDVGAFEQAFDHYAQANARRRAKAPHNAAAHRQYVDQLIASFTSEELSAQGGGCPADDPIFVVGLPRSGSTLVEQILSSHSQVEGLSERPDLMAIARRLARTAAADAAPFPASLLRLDGAARRALGHEYLGRTQANRKLARPRFVDKFPTNFLHVGLIALILPNARIVDVRRHPLACGLSLFKQNFAEGQAYSYDLDDLGRYYADYIRLMSHFDNVEPGRVHHLQYEDLIADPETEARRLLDHCGLAFENACLQFHESPRPVRTASSEQVRRPLFNHGLEHWRKFEPWLGPLKAALGSALHDFRAPGAPAS